MVPYAVRRLIVAIPLLGLISALLFAVVHLAPGGPAALYAADPQASPDVVERLNRVWGLDRPLHQQYLAWLRNLLGGDWGTSFSQRQPARQVVLERVPATLLLTGSALVFSLLVGVPLGIIAAVRRRGLWRPLVQTLAVLGMSVPTFWSGALVILIFSVRLRWLPAGGLPSLAGAAGPGDLLAHLAAPAVVLGSVYVATWARYVDAALSEVLAEDYVRTARAKGVAGARLLLRHALPNAALPLITVLGLEMARLFSGALVTEVVFSWPGMGRLLTQALLARDYPVALGVMTTLATLVVFGNILTDLVYAAVDPRVRYG